VGGNARCLGNLVARAKARSWRVGGLNPNHPVPFPSFPGIDKIGEDKERDMYYGIAIQIHTI
jgi:hypothetical protein